MKPMPSSPRSQRGAAALIVTLVLFFVMTMIAAYANRNHVFEQRASANQYRAAQAFEAAEAGADWAIAQLNRAQRVDVGCLPNASAPTTFRERHLAVNPASGLQVPIPWDNAGTPAPLQAACVRHGSGWDCSCPSDTQPVLAAPAAAGPSPAFMVQFEAVPQPGVVRLLATGCTQLGGACVPSAGASDAVARVQLLLGWVPALASAPVAALTTRGAVQAGAAAIGLHNADAASGGIAVHAGDGVDAAAARLSTAPGGSVNDAIVEHDAALHSATAERSFAGLFGMDKALWQQQPGVTRLACAGNCAATLSRAASTSARPMLWIEGDMQLDGPLVLGTADRPVIVIVSGAARLAGAVVIHGLLHAASVEWNGAAAGTAALRGAAVSEAGYAGNAEVDFVYDAAVLATLKAHSGSFARVPGSWRDF
ncbi:hypothetical protein GPROT2_02782 [Gammaproteobacteria bacterium]|nr:hypothetical protein GPROT2_02782 [Gammaproteobacteria bacterium]